MQAITYPSDVDGWPIQAYRWAVPAPKAAVVISHGMAEHGARYTRFAEVLNAAGYDVWAMDHRAHGKTSGPQGLGDFGVGGWDALVADIEQLVDIARKTLGLPVVLFSHSMGAAAAQQLVQTASDKISALVLSGTTARKSGEAVPEYNADFEPARTNYDWLSRDAVEVDAYIDDPLCGFEGQTLINGFQRHDTRRIDPSLIAGIRADLPVLLVAGDADPVNNNLAGLEFLESLWREAGVSTIDHLYYDDGRHEMLNETNRDQVSRDILAWLDAVG